MHAYLHQTDHGEVGRIGMPTAIPHQICTQFEHVTHQPGPQALSIMFTSSPSITSTQPANIHIDRFRVTGPCTHSVLGGGQWEYIDFDSGEIRHAGNGLNGKLDHPDSQFYVRSRSVRAGMAGQLEIHVCPPKLLQRHNVFGHGNLHDYVCRIFDLLTHRCHISVDPQERQYWLDGLYWLTEVHLTANFACQRELLQPIIDAVDQHHGKGKHRNGDSEISLGFTRKRRSTHHVLTLYDKYQELQQHWRKPGTLQQRILADFRHALRVELKLYSQGLAYLQLQSGRAWWDLDLTELYFRGLRHYRLRHAIQRLLTDDELVMLTLPERNVYEAWLHGRDVKSLFRSRSSVHKYVGSIERKTGINILSHRRPERLPVVDLAELFSPGNVLPVPAWAHDTACYVPPLG